MTNIVLRPDLKTAGGEICDILINGRYAGSMALVYREGDRIGGSVQLDSTSISPKDKKKLVHYVRTYIQDLIVAVRAADCDVVVTSSPYDHIIATSRDELGQMKVMDDEDDAMLEDLDEELLMDGDDDDYGVDDPEPELGDEDVEELDRIEMRGGVDDRWGGRQEYYELVIVGEQRNKIEYHVYDDDQNWVAEAFFKLRGSEAVGEISFMIDPDDDEIEAVTDLIVSDFNEDEVDAFQISVKHEGEELEFIELTHEDLLQTPEYTIGGPEDSDFTVTLARDDGDVLTYEIYNQVRGGLPIGTATVDIAHRQLSGFIDFFDLCGEEEREIIATLLMRELDKEKDYHALNLSVLHRNEKIDEMHFENEPVH